MLSFFLFLSTGEDIGRGKHKPMTLLFDGVHQTKACRRLAGRILRPIDDHRPAAYDWLLRLRPLRPLPPRSVSPEGEGIPHDYQGENFLLGKTLVGQSMS